MNTGSSPSTYESDQSDSEIHQSSTKEHRIAIFDWDNTLFCTDYFALHIKEYKELFEERVSIESFGKFLSYEFQCLEEVK
jgi:hypothetical protein